MFISYVLLPLIILPGAEIDTSILGYSESHVFSTDGVIIGRFYVSEVGVRGPNPGSKFGRIQSGVKHLVVSMGESWIRPPLSEEYVYCVILENNKTYLSDKSRCSWSFPLKHCKTNQIN